MHYRGGGEARQNRNQEHDQSFGLITEDELVNAQSAYQNSTNAGDDFLVRAQFLPVLREWVAIERSGRLNRLITRLIVRLGRVSRLVAAYNGQRGLTLRTHLRPIYV